MFYSNVISTSLITYSCQVTSFKERKKETLKVTEMAVWGQAPTKSRRDQTTIGHITVRKH